MRPESIRMIHPTERGPGPRRLRSKEWEMLETVLPSDRPGYKRYLDLIESMVVLAEGRRGKGNLVLGYEDDTADVTSPLAPVVAYGMVSTTQDQFSVTIRECVGEQIDVEIVSAHGEEVPDHFEEKRRWSYSTWSPGNPSPATGTVVREVRINEEIVLALSPQEKRLWVFEARSGMNLPIPITNFYNELMLQKNIRDPKIALRSAFLFDDLPRYSDIDFRLAFVAYNKLKPKVSLQSAEHIPVQQGMKAFLKRFLSRKQ